MTALKPRPPPKEGPSDRDKWQLLGLEPTAEVQP